MGKDYATAEQKLYAAILAKTKPAAIRWIVIIMLLFAGARSLMKGLGI